MTYLSKTRFFQILPILDMGLRTWQGQDIANKCQDTFLMWRGSTIDEVVCAKNMSTSWNVPCHTVLPRKEKEPSVRQVNPSCFDLKGVTDHWWFHSPRLLIQRLMQIRHASDAFENVFAWVVLAMPSFWALQIASERVKPKNSIVD